MPCQNGSPCALNPLAVLSCGNEVCHLRSFLRDPPTVRCAVVLHARTVRGSGIVSTLGSPQCEICECETALRNALSNPSKLPARSRTRSIAVHTPLGSHGGAGEAAGALHTDRARPINLHATSASTVRDRPGPVGVRLERWPRRWRMTYSATARLI